MAINDLLDRAEFKCLCCGAPNQGGTNPTCECWSGAVDICDRTGACAAHCRCPRCQQNRRDGYERVNWAGTKHVARTDAPRTLCGRAVGGPPVWRRPMLALNGHEECRRCGKRFAQDTAR